MSTKNFEPINKTIDIITQKSLDTNDAKIKDKCKSLLNYLTECLFEKFKKRVWDSSCDELKLMSLNVDLQEKEINFIKLEQDERSKYYLYRNGRGWCINELPPFLD